MVDFRHPDDMNKGSSKKLHELVPRLEGELTRRDREDLRNALLKIEGNTTLVYGGGGGGGGGTVDPVDLSGIVRYSSGRPYYYTFDATGLGRANDEAASGDGIFIPSGTITLTGTLTIAAGVEYYGAYNSKLSGTVVNNGIITGLQIDGTLTNNGTLVDIIDPNGYAQMTSRLGFGITPRTDIHIDDDVGSSVFRLSAPTSQFSALQLYARSGANYSGWAIFKDDDTDDLKINYDNIESTPQYNFLLIDLSEGEIILNPDGESVIAFRVAGDNQANLIVTDPVNDRVGIATAAPSVPFEVTGETKITGTTTLDGAVVANESGADVDFRVEGDTEDHLLTVDAGEDAVRLGDWDTNYAQFAVDGELTLVGTARVTKEFTIPAVNLLPGNQGPNAVILGNTLGYSYDIGDDSVMSFEIPYDCDTSADIKIEIYWYINEARTGANEEVQWRVQWSACPADASEAIDAPTHTGTIDFGDQLIPTTAKFLTEKSGLIAAASISDGDFVSMTLDRVALDDGADPTADPVIVQIEVEYTSHRLGEAT